MARKPFLIAVYDDDARTFELRGPMADDTSLTESVWKAQKAGRKVRCATTDESEAEIARLTGYRAGKVALS